LNRHRYPFDLLPRNRPPLRASLIPCTTLFRSVEGENGDRLLELVDLLLGRPVGVLADHPRDPKELGEANPGAHAHRLDRVADGRSEEHTSELQSREKLVCRLLLAKKKLVH